MTASSVRRFDIVVVSADPAAAFAALDCARVGLRVAVIEPPRRHVSSELPRRNGTVEAMCEQLGLDVDVVRVEPGDESVSGIPANAFAPSVRARVGGSGAWRVYLDRLMPVMRIGNERSLERLVTRRLGRRAWSLLVRPRCEELCGRDYVTLGLDVADIAPGLSEAMSRVGSLTLGVIELMSADRRNVETVRIGGGIDALWSALNQKLDFFAVTRIPIAAEDDISVDMRDEIRSLVTVNPTPTATPKPTATPNAPADRARPAPVLLETSAFLWDDVGLARHRPTLDRAIEYSLNTAEQTRLRVLSDASHPPVGPIDLEG